MPFDVQLARRAFPSLSLVDNGKRRIYFDNPGGTQVPQPVVDAITTCMLEANANLGAKFLTSQNAGRVVDEARLAMADLLNAPSPNEIVFGQSMTTITMHLSRSIGLHLSPGDEIILTRMEHDANVTPWTLMARDHDLKIRWLPFNLQSYEFDLAEFESLLTEKTRLVCINGASNLTGTLNDVKSMCALSKNAGAWSYIDAVQFVPHVSTDVQEIDCDFLVCSAYKFFGPHQSVLYGRGDVMRKLEPYKLRAVADEMPESWETGTQNHEALAGLTAAVDYIAGIGDDMAQDFHKEFPHFEGRRKAIHAAMRCFSNHEMRLAKRLIDGLQQLPGVKIHGVSDPAAMSRRVPTVSFTVYNDSPKRIADALADENLFVWSGDYYAIDIAADLGILDSGGAVRIGLVHYNTMQEIEECLLALESILSQGNAA